MRSSGTVHVRTAPSFKLKGLRDAVDRARDAMASGGAAPDAGAEPRSREVYRRFFVGQLLAASRFTKLRPDLQPRESPSRVAGKWWKQRSPLATVPRATCLLDEAALAAAFDPRTFSYEDWWNARRLFEIGPLRVFARSVGRGYAYRRSADARVAAVVRRACGFPAAPGPACRLRRSRRHVKQLWSCIYTVLSIFVSQSCTREHGSPLSWAGAVDVPADARRGAGAVLRCAVTGEKSGVGVYRCCVRYPSHTLAHWVAADASERIARRGYLRWVDHPDALRAYFSVPLCAAAGALVGALVGTLVHASALCEAGSSVSNLGNQLLGGRNIVPTRRPLRYVLSAADVGCDMALARARAIDRGCAWLDGLEAAAAAAAAPPAAPARKRERADVER
jgi:hypothetical protein